MSPRPTTPSEILKLHGVNNTRSAIRALARAGYGFARIAETPDDAPDAGDLVAAHDGEAGAVWDLTRGIHPTSIESATIDDAAVPDLAGLLVGGRYNQSDETTRILLILHADAAAQIIHHIARFARRYPSWRKAIETGGTE